MATALLFLLIGSILELGEEYTRCVLIYGAYKIVARIAGIVWRCRMMKNINDLGKLIENNISLIGRNTQTINAMLSKPWKGV